MHELACALMLRQIMGESDRRRRVVKGRGDGIEGRRESKYNHDPTTELKGGSGKMARLVRVRQAERPGL